MEPRGNHLEVVNRIYRPTRSVRVELIVELCLSLQTLLAYLVTFIGFNRSCESHMRPTIHSGGPTVSPRWSRTPRVLPVTYLIRTTSDLQCYERADLRSTDEVAYTSWGTLIELTPYLGARRLIERDRVLLRSGAIQPYLSSTTVDGLISFNHCDQPCHCWPVDFDSNQRRLFL